MLAPQSFIYETNPNKQDANWANQVVTYRRMYWLKVVTDELYLNNMNYLLGIQSLERTVKIYFEDVEFLNNVKFTALPLMEKPRNILIDETKKSGIKPYINATDPASINDKERDRFRLQNRRVLEDAINQNRSKIGAPSYKMDYKTFNGNVDEFDKMGMNEADQSEVNFFFDTHYKLKYVADAQTTVNSFLNLNGIEDDIPRYINNILAVKAVCKQDYISPATGQIRSIYIQPNQCYAIMGRRRDGKDASAKGWEMLITLQELMNQLGDAFDFEKDWKELISSINYGNNTTYDGFIRNGEFYNLRDTILAEETNINDARMERNPAQFLDWGTAISNINYKVYFGYIEWPQPCIHTEKRNKKTGQRFTVDYEFKPTERSLYEKEEWGYFKAKCSNYLATGAYTQKLYGYGDLYHQHTEGQNDEYCAGSISIIREEGLSAVDVSKMYIDLANYAYYKMLWAIHSSQPDKWSWSLESIYQVAMKMQQENTGTNAPKLAGGFGNAVNDLIEKFNKKHFMLHTYPVTPDGQLMGGGSGSPHQKILGNLDALAIQLREFVLEWAENQITDKLGLGGLREANAPNPKDGLKLNEIYLKQSRSATGYIPEMVQKTFEHTAKLTLQYIQDIIKHPGTLAYTYLQNMVGDEIINSIKKLGDVAAHRQGIFVNSLDTAAMKEEMVQQASIAQQQGKISFAQYLMIQNIDDPRLAGIYIAYYEEKAVKQQQSQLMQLEQFKQQGAAQAHEYRLEEINTEGMWGLRNAQAQAQAHVQGKQVDYSTHLDSKQLQIQSKPQEIAAKVAGDKELEQNKSDLEQQNPFAQ